MSECDGTGSCNHSPCPHELTLASFAAQLRKDYSKHTYCYIAVMPATENGYDLEVEMEPEAIIGGTFSLGLECDDENQARTQADALEVELVKVGFTVVKTREEWEDNVVCCLCHLPCPAKTAHRHQGEYIGDACCWDERLRSSE